MPSNMIINTESVVGYNNNLMKATDDMKFGVNTNVNLETKPVGITHNLGSSKVKLPQAAVKAKAVQVQPPKMDAEPVIRESPPVNTSTQHEDTLIVLTTDDRLNNIILNNQRLLYEYIMSVAIFGSRNFKDNKKFCMEVHNALDEWGLKLSEITIISGSG